MINPNFSVKRETLGNEGNLIVVVDDFLSDPEKLREEACRAGFRAPAMLSQRKGYPGIRAPLPSESSALLIDELEGLIRREFCLTDGLNSVQSTASFNLMTVPESELGPYQTIPHFDTSKRNFFAALLYLCGEEHGGTAFYRHNSSGYESITPQTSESYLDYCYTELNSKVIQKKYFSESDDYYTKIGFVPAKYNRLVIYKGALLHSANILSSAGSISSDPRVGRLTQNSFLSFE